MSRYAKQRAGRNRVTGPRGPRVSRRGFPRPQRIRPTPPTGVRKRKVVGGNGSGQVRSEDKPHYSWMRFHINIFSLSSAVSFPLFPICYRYLLLFSPRIRILIHLLEHTILLLLRTLELPGTCRDRGEIHNGRLLLRQLRLQCYTITHALHEEVHGKFPKPDEE